MKWVSSSLSRGTLLAAMAVIVITVGCHPKPAPPPPPVKETPPPPPPPKPTVTLQANPSSIDKGGAATLSWTSTDATQLTISPEVGAVTAQGSTQVHPSDSTTYTITASGPGGSADASARVTVNAPPPPPPPAPTAEDLWPQRVKDAYFDFNKFDIRSDAREALGQTAEYLRQFPQVKVTIEGHCDERGSTEYNLTLGDRRANAVKQYMVSLGISADRMSTVSYGKEKPFCDQHTEECWQTNRRGHFIMAK